MNIAIRSRYSLERRHEKKTTTHVTMIKNVGILLNNMMRRLVAEESAKGAVCMKI